MLGVVLCGGQSTRMGSDKGLLKLDAYTYIWAKSAADKLSALSLPVVISVNPGQYETYRSFFAADSLVKDNEKLSIKGPLYGVLSVHLQYPTEDLLVTACDMPLMESFVLQDLLALSSKESDKDAFVFTNHGEPEPLCGIYTAKGLASVFQLYQKGELKKHSMKFMLEQLSISKIPVDSNYEKYFQNFNSHAALNCL